MLSEIWYKFVQFGPSSHSDMLANLIVQFKTREKTRQIRLLRAQVNGRSWDAFILQNYVNNE